MKELLIIRSVSFQQLDKNIVAICKHFPDHRINLLTHEHGLLLAQKYKAIDKIYVYPYKENFAYRRKVRELKEKDFDSIIIPVTNLSGAGFVNVFLFSLSLKAKKRYVCNVISELREITTTRIMLIGLKNKLISLFSFLLTLVMGFFAIIILPLKLYQIQNKERK